MKRIFQIAFFLSLSPTFLFSQAIVKGSGIVYTNGAPTHSININTDAEIAIDTTTGYWYERSRDGLGWLAAGFRIQTLAGSSPPSGAPADKESEVVVNDVDSLYRWRSGSWRHLNKIVTYSAGTGINITSGNVIENTGDLSDANEGILGVGAGGATSSTLISNTSGAAGVTINAAGILSISETTSANGGSITITGTEVDGSLSNEGTLGVGAGGATSSTIVSNTSGAAEVTINAAGILSISETTSANGGSITITGTEVDGSVTNELQTIANTSDATSHTVTLSNSGGSVQLVEGANVTLTTTGTGSAGIVTIAATSGGGTDLSYSGASSPVTLASSTGTDVTITEGGIVTLTATSSNLTISATEVDGSVTNELQTLANTSNATSHTVTLSNSGGSVQLVEGANITLTTTGTGSDGIVTIASTGGGAGTDLSYSGASSPVTLASSTGTDVTFTEGGIVTITATSSNLTISATEVDGSVTNELQTIANTSDATSHTVTLSNSGGSVQLVEGSNITLTTTGTGSDGIVTVAATEVDGSITNEGILGVGAGGATSSTIITNTSTGNAVTVNVAGILTIGETTSANGGSITITGTEVDGSVTNELQTIANTSDATSHTVTLSNSGGSIQLVEGSNITLTTTGTGSAGIVTIASTGGGAGTDLSYSGASSPVTLASSTGTDVTITEGGIVTITATSSNLTISATEVDGSVTNELQTIANTSDATSHTVTLSNSGGSIQLVEGANVTLTTSGTGSDGIVTIAATSGGGTDLSYSGASSPVTLASSSGTDVTITEGGIVTITATSSNLTISATEVDGSVTNELQTIANTSDATSHTVTLSNSGGSIQLVEGANVTLTTSGTGSDGIVTIAATSGGGSTDLSFTGASSPVTLVSSSGNDVTFTEGGIVTITATSSNLTISATEVDGSVTNELQTLANTSNATSHTVTLSNSGGSVQLVEGTNVTLTTSGTGSDGIVTIASTEVDGSITNEGILGVGAGGATSSTIITNTSTGNAVTVNVAGILTIGETTSANGGSITITGTEVDGSVTNEAWTIDADDADTEVISNQTVKFEGAGITTTDYNPATDVLLITSTEVDGSVTNELQTIANTSDATSHTVTLSNSGGSIQLVEGSNITLTTTGTGSDGIVTIAATGGGSTDLSFTGASSPVTLVSSSGNDVTFTEGGIVTITATSSNLTISATEVDGSVTNELQTLANTSDATSHTVTLSNSGGSVQLVEGSNVTLTTTGTGSAGIVTIASTEVDGSITNEGILGVGAGGATSSTIITNTSTGNAVTINAAGILSISETTSSNGGSITITGTEVDGSVTNELQTIANTSDATSHTVTLSNSGGSIQLVEGSNITLTTTGTGSAGIVTIASTGGGASTFLGLTDSPSSYSGQAGKLVAVNSGETGVEFIPTGSPTTISGVKTLLSNDETAGTEVTNSTAESSAIKTYNLAANTFSKIMIEAIVTGRLDPDASNKVDFTFRIKEAGSTVATFAPRIISATTTGVDGGGRYVETVSTIINGGQGSTTALTITGQMSSANANIGLNVLAFRVYGIRDVNLVGLTTGTDLSYSGSSSPVTLNSSTGTDVTLTQGGIVTITGTSSNLTISATEVDGSVTNELQTLANTSDATSHTVTLSNSGGSVQLVEGSNVTLTTTGTGSAGIVTIAATEVDGSITNEGILGVGAGGATSSTIITNTSTGNAVTVNVAGILSIGETTSANGGSITITGTEVDGSVTNELQTIANTSDATSHTVTLSNSGGSIQLVEGSNITLTTTGTGSAGIVTIAATEVDGSITNEGSLSVSAGGANDSQIASNTSGSTNVTIAGGTGVQVTESGSTITVSATATTLNAQTGTTYTLVLADAGKFVTMSNAAANTLTIPPNSSVAFPTGTVINIAQGGAGQTTIAPGSGVTINSADSKTKLRVQYSSSSILKTGTDVWLLVGDITN